MVIVGGGFAGLEAAKGLADAPVSVLLIDRRNHHLFQPLLYQVATAGLNPSDIAQPIRSILRDQPNVEVLLGEVTAVDPGDRTVVVDGADRHRYDYLVLAAGARHAYFGHDEWEERAPGLKSIEDALEIRRRVLIAFERAERAETAEERDRALTFVVVGAGPTGVELAGAVAEIATRTMTRDFRNFDPSRARVLLVEAADRVLTSFHVRLSSRAEAMLRGVGVEVMTGTRVTGIDPDSVTLATDDAEQQIATDTVIWAAGVAASPLGSGLGGVVDRAGRVEVTSTLTVPGHPEVFVVGDLAAATSDGAPVPGVAPAAIQGGQHAAACIRADLAARPRPTFTYRDKGSLATIGRSAAVLEMGRIRLAGFVAWIAWWALHIALLIEFRSRVWVFFSWAWNWVTHRSGARLITAAWRPGRVADADG